jgi:type IV pilus assembly protein PilC
MTIVEEAPAPVRTEPKKSIWQYELVKKKVSRKDLMHFSRQMAVFTKAGIPLLDAIEVVLDEMGDKTFRAVLSDMHKLLAEGATFTDAAAAHPEAFPAFYVGILRTAELTGRLDAVLLQLAEYIERDVEARRKVKAALVYPAVVLVMSLVTVVVLTVFVLPRFERFFTALDADLPLPTRMLLNTSDFLVTWWIAITAFLVWALLMLVFGLRTARGKRWRDVLYLRLPVVGDLVLHTIVERFCRILSAMTSAGVTLPDAMLVTADATNNAVFKRGLLGAREAMLRGEGLAHPLAESGLFPGAAKQMFRVGEATGTLDEQMDTAADYYGRELDYKLTRFTNLFEPAVVVAMGVLVGFVAIALVSAMYGIFNQVKI